MTETHQPGVIESTPKQHRNVRVTDIVIFTIIAIVIIVLAVTLFQKLSLKHEVNQAEVVSNKVIAAMAKQDTATIRRLGDASFQKKNSASSLSSALTFRPENSKPITFAEMYGSNKPTIDREIVANNSRGQHVAVIYKYTRLKVPFYVRIDVTKAPGSTSWTLQALSASPDETSLQT